ncbi:hypothetical protein T5B8_02350 [Salinisphaera sp. T5B8]|uniref:hypothetical protein n=1 Tax=unclassified Salinisphaera TaxID=2649847 RepID=UPI0033424BBE
MVLSESSARFGAAVLLLGALASLSVALYGYFAALTGVTGTLGALAAIVVSGLLIACAGVLARGASGRWRNLLAGLVVLMILGNAFAGALLHEWWLCAAMGVALLGLLIDLFAAPRHATTVRS